MTYQQLYQLTQEHLDRQKKIWAECEQNLTKEYEDQGFWPLLAQVKAKNEVLRLRSMPNNGID